MFSIKNGCISTQRDTAVFYGVQQVICCYLIISNPVYGINAFGMRMPSAV